uniref:RNase H type-1 domain-containing protein n=1 Tax=Oryza punctata TaxID=4537 RepID=A0A0E0LYL2_ORYPU
MWCSRRYLGSCDSPLYHGNVRLGSSEILWTLLLSQILKTPENVKRPLVCPKTTSWMPPPEGYLKINVDAAVSRSGNKGAVGAICRDTSGKFVGTTAMVWEGLSDPTTLEALACNEVVAIAMDCNIHSRLSESYYEYCYDTKMQIFGSP